MTHTPQEWVETSLGADDEGWREFRDIGTSTYYERIGGKELRIDYDYWGARDYEGWENVFQSYEGIDGESYNDYSAFTLNPDGTLTAARLLRRWWRRCGRRGTQGYIGA